MVHTFDRKEDTKVDTNINITKQGVERLSMAAENCWQAIMNKDLDAFAKSFQQSFEAQVAMFPNMIPEELKPYLDKYSSKSLALKLSGAGGGGYIAMVVNKPLEDSVRIKIRRKDNM